MKSRAARSKIGWVARLIAAWVVALMAVPTLYHAVLLFTGELGFPDFLAATAASIMMGGLVLAAVSALPLSCVGIVLLEVRPSSRIGTLSLVFAAFLVVEVLLAAILTWVPPVGSLSNTFVVDIDWLAHLVGTPLLVGMLVPVPGQYLRANGQQ